MATVLVVEDEIGLRLGLTLQLQAIRWKRKPLEVLAARNAVEAKKLVDELVESGHTLALALLDLMLPGTNGVEVDAGFYVASYLREKAPGTPVIFLTIRNDKDAWNKAKEYPAARYFIAKPWSSRELKEAVLACLSGDSKPIQKIAHAEEANDD